MDFSKFEIKITSYTYNVENFGERVCKSERSAEEIYGKKKKREKLIFKQFFVSRKPLKRFIPWKMLLFIPFYKNKKSARLL